MAVNRMHAESAIQVGKKVAEGFKGPLAKYSQIRYGDEFIRRYAIKEFAGSLRAMKKWDIMSDITDNTLWIWRLSQK